MAQQSTIMKPGKSYAIALATNATGSQALSAGCRYVRVVAANALYFNVANTATAPTATNGIFAPGGSYGPDILDVNGFSTINALNPSGTVATTLYITELSA